MNDIITIKSDMYKCDNAFNVILDLFDDLYAIFNEIDISLEDKAKWEGKTHDKCVNIHELIVQYANAIRPICVDFQKNVNDLVKSVEEFVNNSYCIERLRRW
jgi:hypothetical protein